MKLMPIPDENFKDLLSHYGSDTLDNGFADDLFENMKVQTARRLKAKRICLLAAAGLGAIIAGLQVKGLSSVLGGISLADLFGNLTLPMGAVMAMMLAVWLMEQRDVSL